MNTLLHTLVFTCREAGLLIEKKREIPLTVLTGFRLKLHLSVCKSCRIYATQSEQIHQALKKNLTIDDLKVIDNESLKEKILNNLKKE